MPALLALRKPTPYRNAETPYAKRTIHCFLISKFRMLEAHRRPPPTITFPDAALAKI